MSERTPITRTVETRVSEIMTSDPVTTPPTATIGDVIRLMYSDDIRHLPVVEGTRLLGIVSDRDLRSFSLPDLLASDALTEPSRRLEEPISSIMRGDVLSIDEDASVDALIDLMLETKIGAIPVVESGSETLVGIASYIDILETARGEI